ncbi:terminase large subunit domain-containing protein [Streptomyces sp. 35G-GA-8]|uniref:terminase large subunit domain-containing protein n=1 Tax=Streptomyces sp. 35G-GA-8 TaxID=2939434 RepID=UPI00201EBFF7|nr:terminase family protein [Streptomyces sp. 35G-GA-8]MCL7377470.1 terminase family protein [Streptomyces sp. 35G-GA-8]
MTTRAEIARWPAAAQQELLTRLEAALQDKQRGRVPWLCDRRACDGLPHPGREGAHARTSQRPPGGNSWDTWLLLAGRGFGKTRTGAEWVWRMAKQYERGALIGPTAADTRDILVEGESGILACAPARFRPLYEPSKRRVTYPNGAIQTLYSADEPDRLRGPQHHYGWFDELAAWRRLRSTWDMAQMGMRLGDHPRICITTTPRPLPVIKELLKDPATNVVRGSTYDNLHNLAPTFRRAVVSKYEGTTLGRQELDAEVLDDMPGALVARSIIEGGRVETAPALELIVVGMDPAGTGAGDETGLIAAGRGTDGVDYVLRDVSKKMSPREAARRAWALVDDVSADALVYEDNLGKQWVEQVLKDAWKELHGSTPHPPLRRVTATVGKKLRAQPVAMRYEQQRVRHVGVHGELEDQLATWIPEEDSASPDRIDAMVHAVTHLMKRDRARMVLASPHAAPQGRPA